LPRDGKRFVDGDRALGNAFRQGWSINQFHNERSALYPRLYSKDSCDVGMMESGKGLGLALEARHILGVVSESRWEDLNGDLPVQLRVHRLPDHAHATFADFGGHPVVANGRLRAHLVPQHGITLAKQGWIWANQFGRIIWDRV